GNSLYAQPPAPDTVSTGVYITSIHDIDFKQKEYSISFWLWFKYKNKAFDFKNNLEIPNAKSFTQSYVTTDTSGGRVYMLMKMQCVMKDSWKINNFPFDKQRLRLFIENSQYDSRSLFFVADTVGEHYDKRFALNGWIIDSCVVFTGVKKYETAFGDDNVKTPRSEYSSFRVRLVIDRAAGGLFWKMFLGMYIAFLIAYVCFFIHADILDARFGLSVGALFAVVGNKYIIDSSLPESTSFTLVDTLHGITLFCILAVIVANAWSLRLVKRNKHKKADQLDRRFGNALLAVYTLLNIYFIWQASR
ncbi:MAG: hypothetical protein HOP10_16485, partial [Chitinophagaceae bacterium]|nr:hypothetical protein [Chitinophagaceae bacterium]